MVISVNSKMTAIADAIRNLLDISGTMGLDAMASNISSITKRGAVTGIISTISEQYIIPAGYHNGNGSIGIADAEQAKLIAENIKNGVTILGVSGTAVGDIYSIIAVTYPVGSICTLSDGTTTLTDKSTNGKELFNVPNDGTWTMTATDGSKTKSVTVSITEEGQIESVTLTYELTIFSEGSGFADGLTVTGTSGIFAVTDDSITMRLNAGIGYINVKSVDVSSYSTIWVDAQVDKDATYKMPVVFGIGTSESSSEALKSIPHNTARNTFSLDISNLTGEKTLFLGTNCGGGTVYNWWLE